MLPSSCILRLDSTTGTLSMNLAWLPPSLCPARRQSRLTTIPVPEYRVGVKPLLSLLRGGTYLRWISGPILLLPSSYKTDSATWWMPHEWPSVISTLDLRPLLYRHPTNFNKWRPVTVPRCCVHTHTHTHTHTQINSSVLGHVVICCSF